MTPNNDPTGGHRRWGALVQFGGSHMYGANMLPFASAVIHKGGHISIGLGDYPYNGAWHSIKCLDHITRGRNSPRLRLRSCFAR